MKLITVIGARPQFIKAAMVSKKIQNKTNCKEIIIHTGQHFDNNMSDIFFDEMNIPRPKYNLSVNQVDRNEMINAMINKINPILDDERPDGLIVYGDTNSTLAGALSASKKKIPIFHIESGLRSFNLNMKEEINRKVTDHISTLLFCPTITACNNLKDEGISNNIIFSGDVMYDSYLNFIKKINPKLKTKIDSSGFVLSTIHRRENINSKKKLSLIFSNLDKINNLINVVMPLHPHTRKKINEFNIKTSISLIPPSGYLEMIFLLKKCDLVITDSGGLQKESYFAEKKCIVVREETEWRELVDYNINELCSPRDIFISYNKSSEVSCDFSKNFFGNGNSSTRIVNEIISYFN